MRNVTPGNVVDENVEVREEFEFRHVSDVDYGAYLVRVYHYRDSIKPVRVIKHVGTFTKRGEMVWSFTLAPRTGLVETNELTAAFRRLMMTLFGGKMRPMITNHDPSSQRLNWVDE